MLDAGEGACRNDGDRVGTLKANLPQVSTGPASMPVEPAPDDGWYMGLS